MLNETGQNAVFLPEGWLVQVECALKLSDSIYTKFWGSYLVGLA
jgi:hypothetical protein